MRGHGFSRAAYRLLLRAYPRAFRERFAHDLEADFLEMILEGVGSGHFRTFGIPLLACVRSTPRSRCRA